MQYVILALALLTAAAAYGSSARAAPVIMECPTISSGSTADGPGLIATVGEPAIGGATGDQVRMHLGFLGCLGFDTIGPSCPWDLNGDGVVGITDLFIMFGGWGSNPGHPADLDGDDFVGISDLFALFGAWGNCP